MKDLKINSIGGNCPVQAEGTINGVPFYFRARHEHWSLSIGEDPIMRDDAWFYQEPWPHGRFQAGWMSQEEARQCIDKAINKYLKDDEASN